MFKLFKVHVYINKFLESDFQTTLLLLAFCVPEIKRFGSLFPFTFKRSIITVGVTREVDVSFVLTQF